MKIKQNIRRKMIQIAAFGLSNAHVGNFALGKIYNGPWKQFCNPGLNCYSCPAASVACPIGALLGGIPLMTMNESLRQMIGWLFRWKVFLLAVILVGCVLVCRFFCKVICPLGAIYGVLNKVSIYHLEIDERKCVHCGKCARICKMDVNPVLTPDSAECIRCGACAAGCPTGAIRIGFGLRRVKQAPAKPEKKPASLCATCGACDGKRCEGH